MTDTITKTKMQLKQLSELDAQYDVIRMDRQAAIDAIMTDEVKAQLAAIDAEFDPFTDAVGKTIKLLESEIKVAVLSSGISVKGACTATYVKGRVSWDTRALTGYAAAHPEIERFKKVGEPSVRIRRK